jgi:hypothetical protein
MSGIQQMLLGSGGDRLRLDSLTYTRVNPGSAFVGIRFHSDGQVYVADGSSGGVYTPRYNWVTPTSKAASYDVRWNTTANVVDATPGAENTNLNLGTTREWSETNNVAAETCTFQARIHNAGDAATPLATGNITLSPDGSP